MKKTEVCKLKDNKNRPEPLKRIPYPTLDKGEIKYQAAEKTWWEYPAVLIVLVIGLSLVDAATLWSVFDKIMLESQIIGMFLTFGVALSLNFIPLIAGKFLKEYFYHRSRIKLWQIIALGAVFFLLYVATFWLRWVTRFVSLDNGLENGLVSTIDSATSGAAGAQDSAIQAGTTILLGIVPFVTSVINLYLGFISGDPILKKLNRIRLRKIELHEHLAELEACEIELRYPGDQAELERLEKDKFDAYTAGLAAERDQLKVMARVLLYKRLNTAGQITTVIDSANDIAAQ